MDDLISRKAAIEAVNELTYPSDLMDVKRVLTNMPSAKPKHGKWISKMVARDGEYAGWICSNCGYFTANSKACFYNYCPDCGAKMRGNHDTD